jgi:hypothetical protein
MRARFFTHWIFKLWNPFRVTDKSGNRIIDIRRRRKAAAISAGIKYQRLAAGEPERKLHKCGVTRSMNFSGKGD